MRAFDLVGETLRRLRKERRMTLAELGGRAGLGRGQLSRIENGHQEATLSTLAKILASLEVHRREFFRRYDLVENEQSQLDRDHAAAAAAAASTAGVTDDAYRLEGESAALPGEVREALGRVESLIGGLFARSATLAQGAIEVGEYVVLFRVVPRDAGASALVTAPAPPSRPPAAPPSGQAAHPAGGPRRRAPRKKR